MRSPIEREGEREEKRKGPVHIPDALSGQDGRTDLLQGNHGYTSYGKSLYTGVYRFIDESFSFSLSLSSRISLHPPTEHFSWGARAKITDAKLGVRPVQAYPRICQEEQRSSASLRDTDSRRGLSVSAKNFLNQPRLGDRASDAIQPRSLISAREAMDARKGM